MQTHHALLCIGTHEECIEHIPLSERTGIDAEVIQREQLEIAEARALAERAGSRPILAEKRTFVISCQHLSVETQNALLKLFEDPPATAQFYIVVPRLSILLPTLHSRLHLFYETDASKDAPDEDSAAFLGAPVSERLLQIAKLAKDKDMAQMRALIRGIERAAAKKIRETNTTAYLPDILLASTYRPATSQWTFLPSAWRLCARRLNPS
jgi:DNA polymerase III delta prime subunit